MADFFEDVNKLVNGIIAGKINREKAEKIIKEIKREYGDDAFPDFSFEKQAKPWDKAYLQQLKTQNVTGACSEEFILHMAEVGDSISIRKKIKIAGIVIVALMVIIAMFAIFSGSDKNNDSVGKIIDGEKNIIYVNNLIIYQLNS